MARSYKRDKNGRFASTGSSGGSGKSLRQTVQAKRSIGKNKRYDEAGRAKTAYSSKLGPAGLTKKEMKSGDWAASHGGSAATRLKTRQTTGYKSAGTQRTSATAAKSVSSSPRTQAIVKKNNRIREKNANAAVTVSSSRYASRSTGKSKPAKIGPNATIRTKDGNVYRNSDSSMNSQAGVRRLRNSLQTGVRGTKEDKAMGYKPKKTDVRPLKGNNGQSVGAHNATTKKPGEKVSRFSGATTKRSGNSVKMTGSYYGVSKFKKSNKKK